VQTSVNIEPKKLRHAW